MEEEFDFEEIIFYGVQLTWGNRVHMMLQAYLFKVLFFHPRISAKKAHDLLSNNYRLLTHRKHAMRWRKQIKAIVAECDTPEKMEELIQQVAIKIVKWGRQFSWPIDIDIEELAEYLDISWDILITGMYDYFITCALTKQDILDFLSFYEGYLFNNEVDELLAKLSQLKELAEMKHKPRHLTARRLLQSPLQQG